MEAAAFRESRPRLMGKLERTGLFHLEVVPGLDHALLRLESRDLTAQIIERFIVKHFAPPGVVQTSKGSLSGVA